MHESGPSTVTPALLQRFDVNGPRYTSYPTPDRFGDACTGVEVHWQGAPQVRRLVPGVISIFIRPRSFEALRQRLSARAQDPLDVIGRRLANAREEISHVHDFDYVIINSEFKTAAAELQDIVRAERLRTAHQLARHTALINRLK